MIRALVVLLLATGPAFAAPAVRLHLDEDLRCVEPSDTARGGFWFDDGTSQELLRQSELSSDLRELNEVLMEQNGALHERIRLEEERGSRWRSWRAAKELEVGLLQGRLDQIRPAPSWMWVAVFSAGAVLTLGLAWGLPEVREAL